MEGGGYGWVVWWFDAAFASCGSLCCHHVWNVSISGCFRVCRWDKITDSSQVWIAFARVWSDILNALRDTNLLRLRKEKKENGRKASPPFYLATYCTLIPTSSSGQAVHIESRQVALTAINLPIFKLLIYDKAIEWPFMYSRNLESTTTTPQWVNCSNRPFRMYNICVGQHQIFDPHIWHWRSRPWHQPPCHIRESNKGKTRRDMYCFLSWCLKLLWGKEGQRLKGINKSSLLEMDWKNLQGYYWKIIKTKINDEDGLAVQRVSNESHTSYNLLGSLL